MKEAVAMEAVVCMHRGDGQATLIAKDPLQQPKQHQSFCNTSRQSLAFQHNHFLQRYKLQPKPCRDLHLCAEGEARTSVIAVRSIAEREKSAHVVVG